VAVFRRLDPRLHASLTLDSGTAFGRHGLLASASCSGTGRPSSSPLLSRPERRGGQTTLTFDTLRLAFIKVAGRVTELASRIKLALPSSYPYRDSLALLAARAAKPP
jgi:hypothetical protein